MAQVATDTRATLKHKHLHLIQRVLEHQFIRGMKPLSLRILFYAPIPYSFEILNYTHPMMCTPHPLQQQQ